jgi:ketosteroid isomerase-like protein
MRAGRRETYNMWSGQKELLKKVMIERDICMARDENTVLHVFNEYVQAFQTLRAPAVTSYFHFPCMLIAPQGVAVMANATEVESLLDKMMEGLKARGYARSELTDVEAIPLSENIVLVSVSRARYKTDGSQLERLGETYAFRKIDNGWKIVTAMVHDSDVVLLRVADRSYA